MATIKINDLHPTGADLFQDSESYLNELTDEELNLTLGGWTIGSWSNVALTVSVAVTISAAVYTGGGTPSIVVVASAV